MSSILRLMTFAFRAPRPSWTFSIVASVATSSSLVPHPPLDISVSVANGPTQLEAGQAVTLQSAVAHAGGNPAVTWSLSGVKCPSACGRLSSTGDATTTYTAPP